MKKYYRIGFHQEILNSGIWCQNLRHTNYVDNPEVALQSHRLQHSVLICSIKIINLPEHFIDKEGII